MFTFKQKGDIMAKKVTAPVAATPTGNNTSILNCNCSSEYQDEKFGKGKRVHNKARTKSGTGSAWRCTVCDNLKM
jgi:hypothetical protein